MLDKNTKTRLSEVNWMRIAEDDENLSDTVRRYADQSNDAINDFILLCNKLPNSEQEKVITYENISKFIQAILKGNEYGLHNYNKHKKKTTFEGEDPNGYDKNFDNRVLSIAALLVNEGTKVCIEYYKTKNRRPFNPVIDTLIEASAICDTIAYPFRVKKQTMFMGKKKEKGK